MVTETPVLASCYPGIVHRCLHWLLCSTSVSTCSSAGLCGCITASALSCFHIRWALVVVCPLEDGISFKSAFWQITMRLMKPAIRLSCFFLLPTLSRTANITALLFSQSLQIRTIHMAVMILSSFGVIHVLLRLASLPGQSAVFKLASNPDIAQSCSAELQETNRLESLVASYRILLLSKVGVPGTSSPHSVIRLEDASTKPMTSQQLALHFVILKILIICQGAAAEGEWLPVTPVRKVSNEISMYAMCL